jgi:type IX secretion system PorP/SprF family membrane protein
MKNAILGLCVLMAGGAVKAQSYHFSQFFSTPLLTNPANTGMSDGPYRVASNMRSQGGGGNTYFTGYLSGDVGLLRDKLPMGHKAGTGLYLLSDQSLTSAVRTTAAGLSVAYHVGLDDYGENSVGLGLQATYQQRRIDYSKLTFESQYGPAGYDASLPVGEPLDFNSKSFFDLNAGLIYRTTIENKSLFAGFSAYNILQHRENILPDEFKFPTRFTFQAGAQVSMAEAGRVYFSLTSMHQAKANELTFGGAYGYPLAEEGGGEITGGLWYRYKDAVIPYIGLQYSGFQAGISYDYTVSGLKTGSQTRNGIELTLLFRALDRRELKTLVPWY